MQDDSGWPRIYHQERGIDFEMFVQERQKKILEILKKQNTVTVAALSKEFFISETSIRRDLTRLEKLGLIQKTYGGALWIQGPHELFALETREEEQKNSKNCIGRMASEMIANGSVIILDSSSTALKTVQFLAHKNNVTVMTNGAKTAIKLGEYNHIKVYCCGGLLMPNVFSYNGAYARSYFENVHADTAFFSCKAISMDNGISCVNEEEAEMRRAMIKGSLKSVLLCDSLKFDRTSTFKVCDLEQVDGIITEKKPSREWVEFCREKNIELIFGAQTPEK